MLQVHRSKHFVLSQVQKLEADLQRIITHILKADVVGSGIEREFVQALARGIMYGLPLMLLLLLLGRCCGPSRAHKQAIGKQRKAAPASSAASSKRSGSSSKGGKRRAK